MKLGVLASGRGSNLQAILDAVAARSLAAQVRVVISDRRDAPALERARAAGVPAVFLDPGSYPDRAAFDTAAADCLQEHGCDWVALAGYMRLVGRPLLERFPWRVVNIHPALLPAFPGLDAQRQAWEYGVKFSGCTVHFVDEGMDTGPIIAQVVVPVLAMDTPETLAERILAEEHRLYPQALQWLAEGRVVLEGRRTRLVSQTPEILLPPEDELEGPDLF